MIIGNILREKRENLELTQEYVASKVYISQSTYSKIECSKQSINIELFLSLAIILKLKNEDFQKIRTYYANKNSIK